jgi:hypothetical protein
MSNVIEAAGCSLVHAIYTGPRPGHDYLRAAIRRLDDLPTHPDDVIFRECSTQRPQSTCGCGHYQIEWQQ